VIKRDSSHPSLINQLGLLPDNEANEECTEAHSQADASTSHKPKLKPKPQPAHPSAELLSLAKQLSNQLYLGTSSWYFPGWEGLVWDKLYAQDALSKHGLAAYAQHPLLHTVSIDSSFYRPLPAAKFAQYAAAVPPEFRFMVKAPALFCDALIRDREGAETPMRTLPNPQFLDASVAQASFISQVMQGLGARAGVLVFQLSPIPRGLLDDVPGLIERIATFMHALPPSHGTLHALEIRNAELLRPELASALKAANWRYCLGLHAFMPPIEAQLPMLRATWPGPLVCRWSLQRGLKYEGAKSQFHPFNRLAAPDVNTREALAKVIKGTISAGQKAYVTINNKAEGSAPLSVQALAEAVAFNLELA
jgi:uncharacterized protein YecE (DUF72 family)